MLESPMGRLDEMLGEFARRIQHPASVRQFMLDASKVYLDPKLHTTRGRWDGLSLAGGFSGVLVLSALLERRGIIPEEVVHRYVLEMKHAIEQEGVDNLSLFAGVAGMCLAVEEASFGKSRYQKILGRLQSYLLSNMQAVFLDPMIELLDQGKPSLSHLYDVISGICGVGRYSLEHLSVEPFYQLTERIIRILIRMTHPIEVGGYQVPGYYLPPTDLLNQLRFRELQPYGNFNLGLAHGVTGILALLSIAYLKGFQLPGQKAAIEQLSSWIRAKAFAIDGATYWPYAISWEEETQKNRAQQRPTKAGWCYGTPGIARTLFLAGKALNNKGMRDFAIQSITQLLHAPFEQWRLLSPSLCHGLAGLLAVAIAMSREEEGAHLAASVEKIKGLLMDQYNPESPWTFVDVDVISDSGVEGPVRMNKVGFLEGAVGIYLTLCFSSEPSSKWHIPLMIYE